MNPSDNRTPRKQVAVIGGGVAGIVAAHLLQKTHDVTLLEQGDYLGGHTHTIPIPDGPDAGTSVDTGFIVFNEATYPHFISFLEELKVPSRRTRQIMNPTSDSSSIMSAVGRAMGSACARPCRWKRRPLTRTMAFVRATSSQHVALLQAGCSA